MSSMRSAVVAILGAGVLGVAGLSMAWADIPTTDVSTADVPTCPDGKSCAWRFGHYTGDRQQIDGSLGGTGWHNFVNSRQSAKNRFLTSRGFVLANNPNGGGKIYCLWPGEEAHDFIDFVTAESYKVTNALCQGFPLH